MRRWKKRAVVAGVIVAVCATTTLAAWLYRRYEYPYGWSHCCDKAVYFALYHYAEHHDGWFPAGEASPEASLSLLYREVPPEVGANILRGKSVPEDVVQARLDAGELLTPETCGWHYVEGLRNDDDRRLALFWDKAGLDHNGGRLPGGGHLVIFINYEMRHIVADRWDEFLAEQQRLRAELPQRDPQLRRPEKSH